MQVNTQENITEDLQKREEVDKQLENFEKIVFNVKVLKLMNRKSDKIIELFNSREGFFNIYSLDNVKFIDYIIGK